MKRRAFGIADGYGALAGHCGENRAQGAFWRAIRLAVDAPQPKIAWRCLVLQARPGLVRSLDVMRLAARLHGSLRGPGSGNSDTRTVVVARVVTGH